MDLNTYTIETPRHRRFSISTHANDRSVQPVIATAVYETQVQRLLERYCLGRSHILDIGANYGQHTVLMSALNPSARISAIEASVENIEVLNHNLISNGASNVEVIEAFLSDRNDQSAEYFYETSNAGCAFGCSSDYGEKNHSGIKRQVQTQSLSRLIDTPVDFIKMDIEGSELLAIEGGFEIFRACEYLLVELNTFTSEQFYEQSIDVLIDKISSLGFEYGLIFNRGQFLKLSIPDVKQVMQRHQLCEVLFVDESL